MHKPRILSSKRKIIKKPELDREIDRSKGLLVKMSVGENDKQQIKEIVVYVCSFCHAASLSSKFVAAHMLRSHSNEEEVQNLLLRSSKFTGDQTKQASKKARGYKTLYKCPHCDYTTVHLTNYKRHYPVHETGPKYKCPHCSQCSIQLHNLKRHIENLHPDSFEKPLIVVDT